jgi:hypothetical protein
MVATPGLLWDLGRLLHREPRWPSRAEVARALDTSPGALDPWFNLLEFHEAIRFDGGLEVDRSRLLEFLAAERTAGLRPRPPASTAHGIDESHETLASEGIPHVFCMFSAENLWSHFEERPEVQLYVEREHAQSTRTLLEPASHRARPVRPLRLFVEDLSRVGPLDRGGVPVTRPLRTVVDLRAHPQGGAHAEFMEQWLLDRREEA